MIRSSLTALLVLGITPALAQSYGSGSRTGGPARDRISTTGGGPAKVMRPAADRPVSGTHAGGPANAQRRAADSRPVSLAGTAYDPARDPASRRYRSGTYAGGPLRR